MIDENIDNNEIVDDTENTTDEKENLEVEKEEAFEPEESSELALRMINSVKSLNSDQISHYEMVNAFTLADELKCLYLFIKSLPHNPILPMYPETPFLFFKGVSLPKSFNLTEEVANDIENFIKSKRIDSNEEITIEYLKEKRIIGNKFEKLKILGTGEFKGKLKIKTDFISKSAKVKIEKAGGLVNLSSKSNKK